MNWNSLVLNLNLSVTLATAFFAWLLNFIGLCIAQSQITSKFNPYGLTWFWLFLQLAWIIAILYTIISDSILTYRQFIVATSIILLTIIPQDIHNSAAIAAITRSDNIGNSIRYVGLIILFFPVFYILGFFTTESDSIFHWFKPSSGFAADSIKPRSSPNSVASVHPMISIPKDAIKSQTYSPAIKSESYSLDPNRPITIKSESGQNVTIRSPKQLENARPKSNHNRKSILPRNLNSPSVPTERKSQIIHDSITIQFQAKALYNYTASETDPDEMSFSKDDVLDIVDHQGQWWHVLRDNRIGIVPSNFLEKI
ncbi:hypothetical protein BC833DRAFT_579524, partial [Globomyces pollinis-pini]